MNTKVKKKKTLVLAIKHGFAYIALWQFLGFLLLVLMVWANEFIDFAAFFFHVAAQAPNYIRACLSSAAIILAGIIVVGNTYNQQHKIISGMLTICSYCHRIEIEKNIWDYIEEQLNKSPSLHVTHGICSDCIEKVRETWDEESPQE